MLELIQGVEILGSLGIAKTKELMQYARKLRVKKDQIVVKQGLETIRNIFFHRGLNVLEFLYILRSVFIRNEGSQGLCSCDGILNCKH
mmetsp:Transcript_5880/g.8709  ORF Transcript_5880/g.8709 Transcript_5880/m.8709 type:complete len:88 (-) Transcript_5880:786-1049(-)